MYGSHVRTAGGGPYVAGHMGMNVGDEKAQALQPFEPEPARLPRNDGVVCGRIPLIEGEPPSRPRPRNAPRP